MGENSKIEWTHHTFNPWWGCQKVGPGCAHCYAEVFAKRVGKDFTQRLTFGAKHWNEPLKWNRDAATDGERRRVFCASMSDVFEDHPNVGSERFKLWRLIAATPSLDWLLLTKRPENFDMVPLALSDSVWLGVSVENRKTTARIDLLRKAHAAVRFLSVEPLLEDLGTINLDRINWVIVGGESGAGARPMEESWVRSIRDQCVEASVPFFYKQRIDGGRKISLPELDGVSWSELPLAVADAVEAELKGGK